MKRRVKRFVSDTVNYAFPIEQQSFNTNFTNTTPRAVKFPGMSGAFDEYQGGAAPQETGTINVTWKLLAQNYAQLGTLKDAANAMAGSGTGYLLIIPHGQADERRGLRWAEVKPNNVPIPENADTGTRVLSASATFQAYDPVWYGCNPTPAIFLINDPYYQPSFNRNGWVHFDDGLNWDTSGLVWGGPRVSKTVTSTARKTPFALSCTNHGNHKTLPIFRIYNTNLDLSTYGTFYFGIRHRSTSGVLLEGFEWTGTMGDDDVLVIDCSQQTVTLQTTTGDVDAYDGFSVQTGIGFIELEGGINSLEVYGSVHSGFSIHVDYPDAWY